MSSLFNQASLVVEPAVYENGKVYATKPFDGTGDLTFSRASSATRVASNGLIEKVRSNRFTYSQALANAAWLTITDGGTITKTANAGTAPDGTNTATRVQIGGGGTYSLVYQGGVNPLGVVVISGFFKRFGGTNQTFRLFGDNGNALSSTLTATDTWQRFSYVMTASSTGADGIAADASNNAYDILVWGMQLETGDIATDYIATTTAAVSVGPVSGLPRLDYLNSTCPRLLLEPQRSNLVQYSEQINNAYWVKTASSVNANNAVSPDGYTNADQWVGDGTSGQHILRHSYFATTALATFAYSFYVKADGITKMGYREDAQTGRNGAFNIATKTTIFTTSGDTISFQDAANGFVRVTIISVVGSGGTLGMQLFLLDNAYTTGNPNSYSSNVSASEGVLLYGAQIELGAYATSYIPTLGTSVTRVADAASKTGISSLIGQTEGTLFLDFVFSRATESFAYFAIQNASATSRVRITYTASSNTMQLDLVIGGSASVLNTFNPVDGTRYKMAIGYKSGDSVAYRNGVQVGTQAATFTFTDLSILTYDNPAAAGTQVISGRHNQTLLFPTRLSNSDLAALTA
jgi:hypothetical protein